MTQRNMPQVKPDKWVRPSGQGGTAALRHRVVSGGHPPPAPKVRNVRIYRTTLFQG